MSRAVKMLLEKGWITEQQYERAVILSTRYGETPGYYLVNDGAIADDDLVDFFIRHFSLKYCSRRQLKQVTREALATVPHDLARHLRVFPVLVSNTELVLGITDPSLSHAVEEIGYHTQRRTVPVIVSEVDMTWALANYYHIHPDTPAKRYSTQPPQFNAKPSVSLKNKSTKAMANVQISKTGWGIDEWEIGESSDRARASDSALPIATPRNSLEVLKHRRNVPQKNSVSLESMSSFRSTLPPPTSISSPKSSSVRHRMTGEADERTDDIESTKESIYEYRDSQEISKQSIADIIEIIKTATHRDDVISGALDYLLLFSKRAAFFTTKKDEIRGFDIKGENAHKSAIRRYWILQSTDSTFKRTMDERQIHLGPLIRSTSDAVLSAALGGRPRRVIIIPVEIKTRVAGLLYADRLKIEMPPWYLLERLADVVGGALLRLILQRIKS